MPRFHGHHYALEGARPGPEPAHPIAIWLGAARPRALALTGRKADGWAAPLMNYLPPVAAAEAQKVIDRAALEAGRIPRKFAGSTTSLASSPPTRGRRPAIRTSRSSDRPSIGRRS